jgi:hypothetical protein
MLNTLRNIHSLSMSANPRSGLVLTIVVMISRITEGDAQSSSQVASSSGPQTSAQTIAQSSRSPIIYPDDSCNPEHKDLIDRVLGDAMQMTKVIIESPIDYIEDPAFWHIFGQRAVGNTTAIKNAFEQVNDGPWAISAICNFDNSAPCDDFAMYGGIAEKKGDAQRRDETQIYSPHLVFVATSLRFLHWIIGYKWVLIIPRILKLDTPSDTSMITRVSLSGEGLFYSASANGY